MDHLPALILAGHLFTEEGSKARRWLLYILARYAEMPFLKASWSSIYGKWSFLSTNPIWKKLWTNLITRPISQWIDTGVPVPADRVMELINAQESAIAVGPCRCRLAHHSCDHRMRTDIVIRTGTPAFLAAFPKDYEVIDKEEAKQIVAACRDEGMFQMVFIHCSPDGAANEYVICNCCLDGCIIYLLNKNFGQHGFELVPGPFIAEQNPGQCKGCGECLGLCPWDARSLDSNGKVILAAERCLGCGLCAAACKNEGVKMVPRKSYSIHMRSHWPLFEQFHEGNKSVE